VVIHHLQGVVLKLRIIKMIKYKIVVSHYKILVNVAAYVVPG